MPRPREIGPGEIVSTKLALSDVQLLREMAKREGVTVSKLLRKIILQYLHQAAQGNSNLTATNTVSDPVPQPPTYPIYTTEEIFEDFKSKLHRLERKVEELELSLKPLMVGRIGTKGYGFRTLSGSERQYLSQILKRCSSLSSEWYELYKRFKQFLKRGEIDKEMAETLRKIRMIEETVYALLH
ncbi:MAG: hypothetical protein QXX83_07040 [Thermofilum sp.]